VNGDGTIMRYATIGGRFVQAGGTTYGEAGNPRATAKWQAGLDELVAQQMVKDESGNGELYQVTNHGYEVVENL
jgi:hypothetical protein